GAARRSQVRQTVGLSGVSLGRIECGVVGCASGLFLFFFKQKTAYEIGLGIPAEPLFRSGRRVRNRRQLNSLQNTWPYGYSMPIAVRYTQDAFSRSGWLWPVDAKGEPLKATSYMAVGFYVAKYVNKKSDMDLAAKG